MEAFDKVANEWNEYRPDPSLTLPMLLKEARSQLGSLVDLNCLDVGCGNGRNAVELSKHFAYVHAIDSSRQMVSLANLRFKSMRNVKLQAADARSLPFKESSIDCIFAFAMLHHLEKPADRVLAFKEMHRVLMPNGAVLATVWNHDQPKFKGTPINYKVKWKTKIGKVIDRYYHFYTEKELTKLANETGFKVEKFFYEKNGEPVQPAGAANMCFVLKKDKTKKETL